MRGMMPGVRRTALVLLLAAGACGGTEMAYGDANSIIVVAPPDLWEDVQDTVYSALEPSITTTVAREEIFQVTYQSPREPAWANLRKFRQLLLIGSRDEAWIQEALAKAPETDLEPPGILYARDVWSYNQIVTILLIPEGGGREAVLGQLDELQGVFLQRFHNWTLARMFASGRDSALADTLGRQAGFRLLLPEVYYWDRKDSVYIFRNDNPDPSELIRQVTVTWKSPGPAALEPEELLAWRQDVADAYYSVPQLQDLGMMEESPFSYRNHDAYQIQATWKNPPEEDWPAAGPFILRAVRCPGQDRLYLLDAWLYAPGKDKYEYVLQLRTILDSFRCDGER